MFPPSTKLGTFLRRTKPYYLLTYFVFALQDIRKLLIVLREVAATGLESVTLREQACSVRHKETVSQDF